MPDTNLETEIKVFTLNFVGNLKQCVSNNIIYLLTILILTSCEDQTMKDYSYIATSMQTNRDTTLPQEQRPLLIEAKSDSAAYVQAYLNFCIAKKYYYQEFKKSGAKAGQPLSFRLLTEDSIDISKSVAFLNKKEIEKRIEKRVTLFEVEKDKEK